jgi:DNA repair photolyase
LSTLPLLRSASERSLVEPLPECRVWAVNPYGRCSFRCTYCITGVQGTSLAGSSDEIVSRLRAELTGLAPTEVLALGALCDAYPPVEADAGVTRAVLTELLAQHRRVRVITKGTTILRDVDLLTAEPRVPVTISLSSLDPVALARFDPGAPSPQERLEVVAALATAGVDTCVSITPWIPGVSDVTAIAGAARAAAGSCIPIAVGPLNVVSPRVAMSVFARDWDQEAINLAFLHARADARVEEPVVWWPPVPVDGGPHSRCAAVARRTHEPVDVPRGY